MAAVLRTLWPVGSAAAGDALMGGGDSRRALKTLASFSAYNAAGVSSHSSHSNQVGSGSLIAQRLSPNAHLLTLK